MVMPSDNIMKAIKRKAWSIARDEYAWRSDYEAKYHQMMNSLFIALFTMIEEGRLTVTDGVVGINNVPEPLLGPEDKYPNDPESTY
jgi:hypothetical protein